MLPAPPSAAEFPLIALDDWQQGGSYFEHLGHSIFYRMESCTGAATGDGEPLLLIHGFPTASWDWSRLWQPLAQRFQVIAPDLIGFGFSAKPRSFHYGVAAQADLIEHLLAHLGIGRCHVLAHDFGDTVAQELLARQKSGTLGVRLLSVCFLNGGLFPETHRPLLIQKILLTPIGPLIARLLSRRGLSANMTRLFAPETPPTPDELAGFWRLVTSGGGQAVMAKHIRYIVERRVHRERWVGALVSAAAPLRLICGSVDPISGAHAAARYRELVPRPDVVLLPHVGHYPQLEAPGAVLAAFREFHSAMLSG
jgi:pimeloyl-ACP methyl ester carboxylesterase